MWGPYELQVTGNLKDYDRSAQVGTLTVPMLLICGRYDQCTPEETARYHSLVAGSEFVIFEKGSHHPYAEEPEHLVEVVRDFLQRVEARLG
jgi:proline iminopeptidase